LLTSHDEALIFDLQDDRFPNGLAVGGEKCQSVMGLPIIKGDGTLTGTYTV